MRYNPAMAQKIVTTYIDDLTGEESEEISTHAFTVDGVGYEIDLTPESLDRFFDALGPFMQNGRKTGRVKGAPRLRQATDGPSAEEVRAWAKAAGVEVNERGRVPASIREKYDAAN